MMENKRKQAAVQTPAPQLDAVIGSTVSSVVRKEILLNKLIFQQR
jgi:hypothetical protein